MHEMGIISGVIDAVTASAQAAGATKVDKITLSIGEMTEVIMDCLTFAFEALSEGTMCEGAELKVNIVKPHSICLECSTEFDHDRFHLACPNCGSYETVLLEGREMTIDGIEVDIPTEGDDGADPSADGEASACAPSADDGTSACVRTSDGDAVASGQAAGRTAPSADSPESCDERNPAPSACRDVPSPEPSAEPTL